MGTVKVVMSGGTGVLGRAAVPALLDAGHEVVVLTRSKANREQVLAIGAEPVRGDLFDVESLVAAYRGADAVVNLATHVPVGYASMRPGAWRQNDALRTIGVGNVVAAAERAGVRRVVQESVTHLYADHGDDWITEASPVEITTATEPAAVAEAHVQDYACDSRVGVVLRFGTIVGDDPMTRFLLRSAAHGRPVAFGEPEAWTHVVHTEDLGPAVAAALHAPTGVYNVGAEPVRRADLVAGYAVHAGVATVGFAGPMLRRVAGRRMEPLARSLRICSEHFAAQTGWRPGRPRFGAEWFAAAVLEGVR